MFCSAAGDEGDDDVRGVPVEVLSAPIVNRGGAWVSVSGGELNISQRDTSIEPGHDERRAQHVGADVAEASSFADRSHPAMSSASIESLTVATQQDRTLMAFVDG